MILGTHLVPEDVEAQIRFYKAHFMTVEVVQCSECGAFLALELSNPNVPGDTLGLDVKEHGKCLITIGDALLSWRIRLDMTAEGTPMIGYQCGNIVPDPLYPKMMAHWREQNKQIQAAWDKEPEDTRVPEPPLLPMPNIPENKRCGNDTRIAEIERAHVPVGSHQMALSPFEKHRIREHIASTGHKAQFKRLGNKKHYESFSVETI